MLHDQPRIESYMRPQRVWTNPQNLRTARAVSKNPIPLDFSSSEFQGAVQTVGYATSVITLWARSGNWNSGEGKVPVQHQSSYYKDVESKETVFLLTTT